MAASHRYSSLAAFMSVQIW